VARVKKEEMLEKIRDEKSQDVARRVRELHILREERGRRAVYYQTRGIALGRHLRDGRSIPAGK